MRHAPADEYRARLSARRETHARLSRVDEQFSYVRLAVFALAILLAVGTWRGWMAPWWIALPVVTFLVLIVKHDTIIRRRDAAARAITFYDRGLARIEDRWAGGGEQGEHQARGEGREDHGPGGAKFQTTVPAGRTAIVRTCPCGHTSC